MSISSPQFTAHQSANDLRRLLSPSLKSRRSKWIALNGLSADSVRQHAALQTSLRCVGFFGETTDSPPDLIVLDWSTASDCSADGFAMLPVLVGAMRGRGVSALICAPVDGDMASLCEALNLRALCEAGQWIADGTYAMSQGCARALVPVSTFGSITNRVDIDRFLTQFEAVLPTLPGRRDDIELAVAVLVESLQNVRSHARAERAAVTALLRPRRRPPSLEFGLADDGAGVSANILAQERYAWLAEFTDASVTETVLDRQLSGRSNGAGGGGFGAMLKELLKQTQATVILRTGTAHLTFSSAEPTRYRRTNLTYGLGTQLKIELRLRRI